MNCNDTEYKTDTIAFSNLLNMHFTNIGSSMAASIPPVDVSFENFKKNSNLSTFVLDDIDDNEMDDCIANLKNKATSGIHKIPIKFIKLARPIITPILTQLLNGCIAQEIFPETLKCSQIIPIPKIAAPRELGDFRPISLLPTFSKIFEKIIHARMMKFIEKFDDSTPTWFS